MQHKIKIGQVWKVSTSEFGEGEKETPKFTVIGKEGDRYRIRFDNGRESTLLPVMFALATLIEEEK